MPVRPKKKATVIASTITHQALMRWLRLTSVEDSGFGARHDRMPATRLAVVSTASRPMIRMAVSWRHLNRSSLDGRGLSASSVCAGALEKGAAFLAGRDRHRRAEDDAAQKRHRQELALGQHARHVLDPARDEFDLGPRHRQIVEAGAERQQRLVGHVARAFGKQDQRMALVEHRQHDRRSGSAPRSVHCRWMSTEDSMSSAMKRRSRDLPQYSAGGDGMGAGALLFAEAGRQQDEVAMAGMVGEVDALPLRRLAAVPDRPHAGHHPGQRRQADRGHRLQQGEGWREREALFIAGSNKRRDEATPRQTGRSAMRCFVSRRRVPAMRWSSERPPAGVGFSRMRASTSSTAAPPAASLAWLAISRNSSASNTSKAERARVATALAAATSQAAADSWRRLRRGHQADDRRRHHGGRDQQHRPRRLHHQPGGERLGLVVIGIVGHSCRLAPPLGCEDAPAGPMRRAFCAPAPACASGRSRPAIRRRRRHCAGSRARSRPAPCRACAPPRSPPPPGPACRAAAATRSSMARLIQRQVDAARPFQFAGKVDHRAEAVGLARRSESGRGRRRR